MSGDLESKPKRQQQSAGTAPPRTEIFIVLIAAIVIATVSSFIYWKYIVIFWIVIAQYFYNVLPTRNEFQILLLFSIVIYNIGRVESSVGEVKRRCNRIEHEMDGLRRRLDELIYSVERNKIP